MLTAAVMTFGVVEFKTKDCDDQADCEHIGPDAYPGKQQLYVVRMLLP